VKPEPPQALLPWLVAAVDRVVQVDRAVDRRCAVGPGRGQTTGPKALCYDVYHDNTVIPIEHDSTEALQWLDKKSTPSRRAISGISDGHGLGGLISP
jgi:hypothetical protein